MREQFCFSLCTCHVDRLGEDVFLCAASSVVFLCEVVVTGCVSQSGGRQQQVHTCAEHVLEIVCNKPADFLCLHKVVLVVPDKIRMSTVNSCYFGNIKGSTRQCDSVLYFMKDNLASKQMCS